MQPYRVLPAQNTWYECLNTEREDSMTTNSEANIELKGNKQLLIDLGYPPNESCATCGKAAGEGSYFCGNSGHDNHFLSAVLANPKSGPLIREALQVYFANPLPSV